MAAVEITISGVLYDKYNRTQQNVVLFGEASITGLGVGGGPMPPGSGGQPPVGGGQPPHPAFPIWGGPGAGFPDKPGYPPYVDISPPGPQPHPEHPIVLPPDLPPTMPPPDQRPIEWKTAWTPTTGWVVIGVPTGPHPTPST